MHLFIVSVIVLAVLFSALAADPANEWELAPKRLRLPGALRIVSEGLAHDDEFWYLNSKHVLFKTKLIPSDSKKDPEMEIISSNKKLIPDELKDQGYNHVGDIDVDKDRGIIFGGFEWSASSPGVIACWNSTTLDFISYSNTDQKGMPWVAFDVKTQTLYSTAWNDKTQLQSYNIVQNEDLTFSFPFKEAVMPAEGQELPGEIQGAAFDPADPGAIYLAVNGEAVHRMDLKSGDVRLVLQDEAYKHHKYEMEGKLTLYWWCLVTCRVVH